MDNTKPNNILSIVLVCFILGGLIIWLGFFRSSSPATSDIVGWKTTTDGATGVTFQYPEKLPTTYISIADWPPRVSLVSAPYSCLEFENENDPSTRTELHAKNGNVYCVAKKNEGAAGSTYTTYTYSTSKGDMTVIFTFGLRFVQCANYSEPDTSACLTERTSFDPDSIVDQIFSTLKIP